MPEHINLIPRHLIEQVKDERCDVDRFYKGAQNAVTNPLVGFYVLVDNKCKIKGVLWYSLNEIEAVIYIHLLSIDKEYQFSDVLKEVVDFSKGFKLGPDYTGIMRFITNRPKAFEKVGFKPSKKIIMEMQKEIIESDKT